MALSPSAAANRRFGFQFKPEITPPPIPTNPGTAPPLMPTLILIGSLDEWTLAADCSEKVAAWGSDKLPIDLVVYPRVHHGFYYPELQPGRTMLGRWLEYNEEAATDASRRMREFLKRHLN
jgi:dienelactone hydrolase